MSTWEKAAVIINGVVGAAAAATAWAALRSAKAAEKAANGNTQTLGVARDSADAARDAADSFGEAVKAQSTEPRKVRSQDHFFAIEPVGTDAAALEEYRARIVFSFSKCSGTGSVAVGTLRE